MERELLSLFAAARKAAEAATASQASPDGAEVSRCVDALKKLRAFNINKDLLVSTMVGKKLRCLKKHPKEKIKSMASEIIETWKTIFLKELANGGEEDNRRCSNNIATKKLKPTVEKPQNVDVSRKRIRDRLVDALSRVATEAGDESIPKAGGDPLRVASAVEAAMFAKLGEAERKKKMRSILFNLGDPKNPDLRRKVLAGEIAAERLVAMSNAEMASEEMQRRVRRMEEKALAKCQTGGSAEAVESATTDQFRCGRCGQRKTVYRQMQTRSADEPMTTYVTCVNCNNHWKFC